MIKEEKEIRKEYDEFIKTEKGQEWKKRWQTELGTDTSGDFGDYLYDFYPEMLA